MCDDCQDYQPWAQITPDIKNAVGWLFALYQENAAGGLLHAEVDDMNLPVSPGFPERSYREPTDLERKVRAVLCQLTEHEQATAIAIKHGHYQPEGTNQLHLAGLPSGLWAGENYWTEEIQAAHDKARWGDWSEETP